jgi:hypothetical protein
MQHHAAISRMLRLTFAAAKVIAWTAILSGALAKAQEPTHISWLDRATITRASQPNWVTPLITASANLEEAPIYDISRKLQPSGHPLVTAGGPRGIQFVPFGKLQLTFGATPYLIHNDPKLHDGFGDTSFAFKYRLASGNEQHGNFAVSAQIATSIATGSYQNGQKSDALTPNFLVEKGWGRFNVQSTYGATLPSGGTRLTGRQYVSNTALQGRFARILWPELELNSTTYKGGPNNGKTQAFLTPGVILGRFPLTRSSGLSFGVGMQIAVTQYHSYDHSLIFSVRLPMQSHRRE